MCVFRFAILVAAFTALGGCCSRTYVYDCPSTDADKLIELRPGDPAREVRVLLKEKCNPSGIKVAEGHRYEFTLTPQSPISDGPIKCLRKKYKSSEGCVNPIGKVGFTTEELPWYVRTAMWFVKGTRPVPDGRWLEVVGTIGREDKEFFSVRKYYPGTSKFQPSTTGELFFLANDYPSGGHYRNNEGEVTVTVRAVSAEGGDK